MNAYCPHCGKRYKDVPSNWSYCNECGEPLFKNVMFFLDIVIIMPKHRKRHKYHEFYNFVERILFVPKHSKNWLEKLATPIDKFDEWYERMFNKFMALILASSIWVKTVKEDINEVIRRIHKRKHIALCRRNRERRQKDG